MKSLKILLLMPALLIGCNEVDKSKARTRPTSSQEFILGGGVNIAKSLISHSHRDSELDAKIPLISTFDESFLKTNGQKYPSYYRDIPQIDTDHDNRDGNFDRPQVACGNDVNLKTIAEKIKDCEIKNSSFATALGNYFGNMGEGNWSLVVKTQNANAGFEIWIDLRTRLVWSDRLTANNWCKASGNQEDIAGIDCGNNAQEFCGDDKLYVSNKGNLESIIDWRLPTRNDFLQADINGSRQILKNTNFDFWTSTVDSTDNEKAWTINVKTGELNSEKRDSTTPSIRCVGRILK